jgi:hypothetical protein
VPPKKKKKTSGLGSDPFSADTQRVVVKLTEPGTAGKPRPPEKPKHYGTPKAGSQRVTYHLPVELAERVRNCAYWERRDIRDVVAEALGEFLKGRNTTPPETKPKSKSGRKG